MIRRNPNKYAGTCLRCGHNVPANGGYLTRDPATRKFAVRHWPQETVTPSGPWDKFEPFTRGGCPGDQTPWSASYTPPNGAESTSEQTERNRHLTAERFP